LKNGGAAVQGIATSYAPFLGQLTVRGDTAGGGGGDPGSAFVEVGVDDDKDGGGE